MSINKVFKLEQRDRIRNHFLNNLQKSETMKKEQSSIEWLRAEIFDNMDIPCYVKDIIKVDFETAVELHKKEIIEAATYGNRQEFYDGTETMGEKYYTEKYIQ